MLIHLSNVSSQTERSDMLEAIRQLTQNIRLKDMIIANFIPEDMAKNIERRAVWNPDEETWIVQVPNLSRWIGLFISDLCGDCVCCMR